MQFTKPVILFILLLMVLSAQPMFTRDSEAGLGITRASVNIIEDGNETNSFCCDPYIKARFNGYVLCEPEGEDDGWYVDIGLTGSAEGWEVVISPDVVRIASGDAGKVYFMVDVFVPFEAECGEVRTLTVVGEDLNAALRFDVIADTALAKAGAVCSPRLVPDDEAVVVKEGAAFSWKVTLENGGNNADQFTVSLGPGTVRLLEENGMEAGIQKDFYILQPGEQATIAVRVDTGDHIGSVKLTIIAISLKYHKMGNEKDQATLDLTVEDVNYRMYVFIGSVSILALVFLTGWSFAFVRYLNRKRIRNKSK